MTIPILSLFTPKTPAQWLAQCLTDGTTQGLTTTSWQSGDPLLTILAILSEQLGREDTLGISMRSQGAFLDYAASGSVTITDDLVTPATSITVPVTPDPSIPAQNPTGAPGFLDVLASSGFNVQRIKAAAATNTLYLTNTSGVSIGTFLPGTFHTQNVFSGATYNNSTSFTFSPSSTIDTSVTSVPVVLGTVQVIHSANHGLSTGAVVYVQNLLAVQDGFYQITVSAATAYFLNGAVPTGTPYVSGGLVWSTQSVTFAADMLGPVGNAGVGQINQLVTAAPKCFCGNLSTFAGTPWQSNASLAAMCRAKLGTISPNGPPGAFQFFTLQAQNILAGAGGGLPFVANNVIYASPFPTYFSLDGGAITRVIVGQGLGAGTVGVVVANAAGTVAGPWNLNITGASATAPIQITTASAHTLQTGDYAQVNGVLGLTGANGRFQITKIDGTHFSLNGSTGAGVYTAATGKVIGGDIYAIMSVLQMYCTPNAVTVTVASALTVDATPTATVYVPAAKVADYITKMNAALGAYILSFPVGGLNVDNSANILPIGAIEGILFAAGQSNGVYYTQSVTNVTVGGAPVDLYLSPVGVATYSTLNGIQVIGV
jgi:hypothetical protein